MGSWMAVKQALTAMDLVMREWARELELDESGVMVLLLLGEEDHRPAADLAFQSGRTRQQVQRSLQSMRARGLVEPSRVSPEGRVQAWMLTGRGRALWGCLERGVQAWEETLGQVVDLQWMEASLRRMAEVVVNCPSADGWGRGLLVPRELRAESLRSEASREGLVSVAGAQPEPGVPRGARRVNPWDVVERSFLALFRR